MKHKQIYILLDADNEIIKAYENLSSASWRAAEINGTVKHIILEIYKPRVKKDK